jgi:protein SCO1/2
MWTGLGLTILLMAAAAWSNRLYQRRPTPATLPVISQVPELTLTNQNAEPLRMSELRGQIWIGDIIFTRCAGPCPEMTRRMAALQAAIPANSPVKLVTLTTDPDHDSPAVLRRYGERFGADFNRWMFLTGSKESLRKLAVDGLKLIALEKEPGERESANDLFIHSTRLVVVDQLGQLRATYESTDPGSQKPLLDAVAALVKAGPR